MSNDIFVGSVSYDTTEKELAEFFSVCGTVLSAKIPVDQATGRSKGVGFVKMSTEAEAQAAIAQLSGRKLGGRKIFASEAKPQEKRPAGSFTEPGVVDRRSGKDRRGTGAPPKPEGVKRYERPDSAARGFKRADRKPFGAKKKGGPSGRFNKKKPWTRQPEGRFSKREESRPKKDSE